MTFISSCSIWDADVNHHNGTSAPRDYYIVVMRVLCVARHQILSEHLCLVFERFDVAAAAAVGMRHARTLVSSYDPDVALCDYDLLTTRQLELWRTDAAAGAVPIIAVSLTKRPSEVALTDARGIVGFVYLPMLDPAAVRALFTALRQPRDGVLSPTQLSWPEATSRPRRR